jgi:epimerase transport system membrane fusion protein
MDKGARTAPPLIEGTARRPLVSDSARGAIRLGTTIVLLFFGVLGVWAALAPLDGAIVGDGVVTVEGNRKSVQHLDGGIVKEIKVKEGDHVAIGDVLVVLDSEKLSAQANIYAQQLMVARATEARLAAELSDADGVTFPQDMLTANEPYVKAPIASQTSEFATRRTALEGNQQVLQHRINDLLQQIDGKRARQKALEAQLASVTAEQESLQGLLNHGLTTADRIRDLDRQASGLQADISDNAAAIASAEENIGENRQQITQLTNDRRAQVAGDLDTVQAKILDLGPSLDNARASLDRTIVRSPYGGTVVGLKVFSTGAVLAPGGAILDIVPDQTHLVIEARVNVADISDLRLGSDAEVHFTTYQRLYVPMMRAKVTTVSADRLTDDRTGTAYYLAQLIVDPDDLRKNADVRLYPGMPAQVMITTQKRSALDYIVGPLFASFDNAFRQR